jgi:hypothetical protein
LKQRGGKPPQTKALTGQRSPKNALIDATRRQELNFSPCRCV